MTYEYERIFHEFSCKLNNIQEIVWHMYIYAQLNAYHRKGQQGKIYSGYL